MIGFFVSVVLSLLAWAPARLLRAFRRALFRRRGVVVVHIDARLSGPALAGLQAALESLAEEEGGARAVLVRLGPTALGWATAQSIRALLLRLREAGKLVVVQLDALSNGTLLIASAADRVLLAPTAEAFLGGVGADLTFYGEALERVGLRAEVVSAGAYKSAGEPFTRAFPSAESRVALSALVHDLHAQLVEKIAEGRGVSPERVLDWMARAPLSSAEAARERMVDGLAYEDQVDDEIAALIGARPRWSPLERYARWRRWQGWLERLGQRRALVAVVHLEGPVVSKDDSGGSNQQIDAEQVVPTLKDLMEADAVVAVVLHIQSPGGSAQASDDIARAVELLARQKPVVAVFGDVAASGGYYIAAPAAEIVASPGSITGSIGVVGGKLVLGGAAARVGIFTERVSAGPDSGLLSSWEPFTPEQRDRFQASLARFYTRFLAVVAGGRRRPVRAIEPVAQGRVWTGQQALALGLVDRLGGLSLGVERAAARASLPRRRMRVIHLAFAPSRFGLLSRLMRRGESSAGASALLSLLADPSLALPRALAQAPGRALAMMPWRVDEASPAGPQPGGVSP